MMFGCNMIIYVCFLTGLLSWMEMGLCLEKFKEMQEKFFTNSLWIFQKNMEEEVILIK